jgi:hippurate hydrolase
MTSSSAAIDPKIREHAAELAAIRRDIHAHPETAFEEVRTSEQVARLLASWGIDVHRGLARTGVVGALRCGSSARAIGLRADMDALPIEEANSFAHRSTQRGKMHACGHDGHTAMLLGAAKFLAETRSFDGTVFFIFQPAEENEGGGRTMVEEGLFDTFPMDAVFGMHNMPGIAVGKFVAMPGAMMASFDIFEIAVEGKGAHAAFPHQGADTIVAAAAVLSALQTIVSRTIDPLEPAVVSATQVGGGDTYNVIPERVRIAGTVRAFSAEIQDTIEAAIARICAGIGTAYGVRIALRYDRRYPPTLNWSAETDTVRSVIERTFGKDALETARPIMAAEDFAFMLNKKPGAFVWIGNGVGKEGGCIVHNPNYDFNDAILPLGVQYWASLVSHVLPSSRA